LPGAYGASARLGQGRAFYEKACAMSLEGIVSLSGDRCSAAVSPKRGGVTQRDAD
jgi:hypothetical protein